MSGCVNEVSYFSSPNEIWVDLDVGLLPSEAAITWHCLWRDRQNAWSSKGFNVSHSADLWTIRRTSTMSQIIRSLKFKQNIISGYVIR